MAKKKDDNVINLDERRRDSKTGVTVTNEKDMQRVLRKHQELRAWLADYSKTLMTDKVDTVQGTREILEQLCSMVGFLEASALGFENAPPSAEDFSGIILYGRMNGINFLLDPSLNSVTGPWREAVIERLQTLSAHYHKHHCPGCDHHEDQKN